MADSRLKMPERRAVLRNLVGLGAVPVGLPMLWSVLGTIGAAPISTAHAADFPATPAERGNISHIPGASAPSSLIAEWYDSTQTPGNGFRIAATRAAFDQAPVAASRYEAKLYVFPSGTLRTLSFKKDVPSYHLITFETIIYVLSGTAILTPLDNHPGKPVNVRAGDALFLPSGVLMNPKPSEDLVILQGFVERTVRNARKSVVTSKQAHSADTVDWQVESSALRAKTFPFEGNTLRVITLKGARSARVTSKRADVLVYVAKGKARRTEGNHVIQIVAGDCVREKVGGTASWEPLEETTLVAIDARLDPAMLPPDQNV
jgi:quercetin dioxygenase-like cupin family protein